MIPVQDTRANPMLALVERGLREIGYTDGLLRRNYAFADLLGASDSIRHVPLAAFAQDPPSYRSACFGVLIADPQTRIEEYRALGAPQLLELDEQEQEVRRWKALALTPPAPPSIVRSSKGARTVGEPRHLDGGSRAGAAGPGVPRGVSL